MPRGHADGEEGGASRCRRSASRPRLSRGQRPSCVATSVSAAVRLRVETRRASSQIRRRYEPTCTDGGDAAAFDAQWRRATATAHSFVLSAGRAWRARVTTVDVVRPGAPRITAHAARPDVRRRLFCSIGTDKERHSGGRTVVGDCHPISRWRAIWTICAPVSPHSIDGREPRDTSIRRESLRRGPRRGERERDDEGRLAGGWEPPQTRTRGDRAPASCAGVQHPDAVVCGYEHLRRGRRPSLFVILFFFFSSCIVRPWRRSPLRLLVRARTSRKTEQ